MSETFLPVHPVTGLRAVGIVAGRPIFPILGADDRVDPVARLAEIDARVDQIRTELVAFGEVEGGLDEEQTRSFDALETELGTLTTEREPVARRAETIARAREALAAGTVRDSGPAGTPAPSASRVQPFADLDRVRAGGLSVGDLQSRALAAVEQAPHVSDEGRARAESLLRTNDRHGRIARHILMTGSPEYGRAFEQLLGGVQPYELDQDAQRALMLASEHNRAMNEGAPGSGGYLVPFYLDPTVILTNAGSINPFRQISRVETITTNTWHGITSAGVTAGYLPEATEASDNSPTFAQPSMSVYKVAAYLQASFEVTQDTGVAAQVGRMLADARDNFEASEFAVGTGTNAIQGVVTGVAANAGSVVNTAAVGAFAVGDVYSVIDAINPRWQAELNWVSHWHIQSLIRQFASGTGQQSGAFWATLGAATPPLLLDTPYRKSSAMSNAVATGNKILLVGDFREYLILDRIGMTVQFEPLVKGANFRPTGQVGWFAHWRTGGGVLVPDAFRLLKVQ